MSDFTRVTIVGATRRAVVVVPNDEAVGTLIPQLMDLLDEPAGRVARPLTLTRLTGEQLDADRSPAELSVADGELLRLVRLDEAPPPPEVSDVTDAVSESLSARGGRWSASARLLSGAIAVGGAAAGAGLTALAAAPPLPEAPTVLWAVAALAALGFGLGGLRRAHGAALAVAIGLVPAVARTALALVPPAAAEAVPVLVLLALAALWLTLLVGIGLARRRPPAVLGAVTGLAGAVLPLVLLGTGLPLDRTAGVTAVVAVVALGLLPAAAMAVSGLAAIDDRVLAGRLTARSAVVASLDESYRALTWTTVACATVLSAALAVLATARDPWLLALAGTVALVTALRTRAFPLTAQVLPLWGAVAAGAAVAAVVQLQPVAAAGAFAAGALVALLLAGLSPAAHRRARLRRIGTLLEGVAVVVLVPLLLGAFDVYAQLYAALR